MIHREKRTVTEERDVFFKRTCDLCGIESKSSGDWRRPDDRFKVRETTVTYRDGDNFPEGGSGTEIKVDICPECFKRKLVPWLKSQGVNVIEEEWNW